MNRAAGILLTVGWAAVACGAPRIETDAPTFDFGTVDGNGDVTHTYVLRNTGDENLAISQVKTSCGCTTTSLSTQNLAAGASVDLPVRFSTRGRRGAQAKNIYVHSNDPATPVLTLQIKGTIAVAVDVQPPALQFGAVARESDLQRAVRASFAPGLTNHVTNAVSQVPWLVAEVQPAEVGRIYDVQVRLLTNMLPPVASAHGQIDIQTDHPANRSLAVQVQVMVPNRYTVIPDRLVLAGGAGGGRPLVRYLLVRAPVGKPLEVVRVTPPAESIQVSLQTIGPGETRVALTNILPAPALHGAMVRITVRREDGVEEELAVPLWVSTVR